MNIPVKKYLLRYQKINSMNIYIDLDNTAFKFLDRYCLYHKLNCDVDFKPSDIKSYDFMTSQFGLTEEKKYNYLKQSKFFDDMEMYENAEEIIQRLYDSGYTIYFVTTCVVHEAYAGKAKSLEKVFTWFDHSIHMKTMTDKHLLVAGLIIDDNPTVIEKSNGHHITVIFNQQHNLHQKADLVINGWNNDVFNKIVNLIEN